MSNIWLISDTHFNHTNLVGFRKEVHGHGVFNTVEEMNQMLVDNCNRVITTKDSVWHLGDVNFYSWDKALPWLQQLKGHWKLVLGNHDVHKAEEYSQFFHRIHGARVLKNFIMTHIPIHEQELGYRNYEMNVHGHVHHKEKCLDSDKYYNVNVDVTGLMPTPLDDILKHFNLRHGE